MSPFVSFLISENDDKSVIVSRIKFRPNSFWPFSKMAKRYGYGCLNPWGPVLFFDVLESGPMGSYHAARGWGLLVAARSSWKHVDGGRLRQSGSMAKHFPL
jgi:hypothetical protein